MKVNLIGGSDEQRSTNLSDSKCINLYPTTNNDGSIAAFYRVDGLKSEGTLSGVPAGAYKASNGRAFYVSGTTLYELTIVATVYTSTSRGTVTAGTYDFEDNGIELLGVNGTDGWLFTFATNTLKQIKVKSADFTVTIADPAVFTSVGHTLVAGDGITLDTTTDTTTTDNLLVPLSPASVSSGSNPTIIETAPSGNFVYALNTDVGIILERLAAALSATTKDSISQYVIDPTTGVISPLSPPTFPTLSATFLEAMVALGQTATISYVSYNNMKISPDGIFLYVLLDIAAGTLGTIHFCEGFLLDVTTGKPTTTGSANQLTSVGNSIDFSDDGLFAYITNTAANTISQYSRNVVTGALTPLTPATVAATSPTSLVISANATGGGTNTSVHVLSDSNVIYNFVRNITTGLLTASGTQATIASGSSLTCKEIALSSDDKSIYITRYDDNLIGQFSRHLTTFDLTALTPASIATGTNPQGLVISPDLVSAYCTNYGDNTISQFSRNATTFLLTAVTSLPPSTGVNPFGIAIAPDGENVYVTNFNDTTISQYSRTSAISSVGLPTGLSTEIPYYVLSSGLTADAFQAAPVAGGTAVATSGVQAGVHTFTTLGYGFPNGCTTVSYMNGRFIAVDPGTQDFYISEVLDGGYWDALNVQTADSNPDLIVGQVVSHNELIVFCEYSGEIFYDSGVLPSPFQRTSSGIFEFGCVAPKSIKTLNNTVFWLGRSAEGTGIIYKLQGSTPIRVSDYGIEWQIQQMSTMADAFGIAYQKDGHHFYAITFPTGNKTFVFDANTNLWHERAKTAPAVIAPSMTWTPSTSAITGFNVTGIAWNGTVYCAVGITSLNAVSTVCYTSTDGITWTARTLPSALWSAISWNGTVFCAVSGYGTITSTIAATSADGITWTARTLPSSTYWSGIAWNGTVFCAIAYFSSIAATSADGISWTARTLPTSTFWKAIAWNGTVFCAVSGYGGGSPSTIAATSADGISWTQRVIPSGPWVDITWNGTVFCAICGDTFFNALTSDVSATSADGITWTARTLPSVNSWTSIATDGTLFNIVNSTDNNTYLSTDGITWTLIVISGVVGVFSKNYSDGTYFITIGTASPAITAISTSPVIPAQTYTLTEWPVKDYLYFNNEHLVTDDTTALYSIDSATYKNGSEVMQYTRSFRAPQSEMRYARHSVLRLEAETGIGSATQPTITLKWSDDNGNTYNTGMTKDMGIAGDYAKPINFHRLGMTKSYPRIYELSGASDAKLVLLGAYLE